MPDTLLSVLICTIPGRKHLFDQLYADLMRQKQNLPANWQDLVEVLWDSRPEPTTGAKRHDLLHRASGKMILYIDDDDAVHAEYLKLILSMIIKYPDLDCIGIQGWMTVCGQNRQNWFISKDYGEWYERDGIYYRTPNHISPVRRDIALLVGFPDLTNAEDASYSQGILPYLRQEEKIPIDLYHYRKNHI